MRVGFTWVAVCAAVPVLGWQGYVRYEAWREKAYVDEVLKRIPTRHVVVDDMRSQVESFHVQRKEPMNEELLVFIHGYNGHSLATWGDLIPCLAGAEELPESLHWLSRYDLLTQGYRSGLGEFQSIDDIANRLAGILDQRFPRYQRVYLLAHSMGGLVVERYLLNVLESGNQGSKDYLRDRLEAVLYFDTPHEYLHLVEPRSGSQAEVLSWFVALESETEEMREGSPFRRDLEESWNRAMKNDHDLTAEIYCQRSWIFAADHTTDSLKVAGSQPYPRFDDPQGRFARAYRKIVPNSDHQSICKTSDQEFLDGRGSFHGLVAPVLQRRHRVQGLGPRPFGLHVAQDGWVYPVLSGGASNDFAGHVRRIDPRTNRIDEAWHAEVGRQPHEMIDVEWNGKRIGISTDSESSPDLPAGLSLFDMKTGASIRRMSSWGGEPGVGAVLPDSLAVVGKLLAISDLAYRGRVWFVDLASLLDGSDQPAPFPLPVEVGERIAVRGLAPVGDDLLLACGDAGIEANHGWLVSIRVGGDGPPRLVGKVQTVPFAPDVVALQGPRLACVASAKDRGGIALHRLEPAPDGGTTVSPDFELYEGPGSDGLPLYDIALVATSGEPRELVAACSDGAVYVLSWGDETSASRLPRNVSKIRHDRGSGDYWGVETSPDGDVVYVTIGTKNTVSVVNRRVFLAED